MLLVVSVAVLQPHIFTLAWVTRCMTALIILRIFGKDTNLFRNLQIFSKYCGHLVIWSFVKIDFGNAVIAHYI